MKVVIKSKSGKVKAEYTFSPNDQIINLKKKFHADHKVNMNRQRFTYAVGLNSKTGKPDSIALTDDSKTFKGYGIDNANIELTFKDLGPQVSWQTVFLVEYFGPILIHSIFYWFPQIFYEKNIPKTLTQQIAYYLVLFHYLKREYESVFVHRFSNETMPWVNIFKNSLHYWFFGGVIIAYYLYSPKYLPWYESNYQNLIYIFAIGMIISELGNLHAHLILRNLRAPGSKERGIPKGQLFNLVSCANYTWETSAWFFFALLTQCLTSWLFLFVSFLPMRAWAIKKHKNYKKDFGDKYPKRKAIIPFLL